MEDIEPFFNKKEKNNAIGTQQAISLNPQDIKLKIGAEKKVELARLFSQAKKDYQQGKCQECSEKIDKQFVKCFACGADLAIFE